MTLPVWAQDTVLALFVAYFQIAGTRRVAPSQEVAQLAHPAELGYLLAVAGMALLLRRRWPLAVFFTTAAISLVYYVAGYPDGPGGIALFVAAYTVTARGEARRQGRARRPATGAAGRRRPGRLPDRAGLPPDRHPPRGSRAGHRL